MTTISPGLEQLSLDAQRQVDAICSRYERRWQAGEVLAAHMYEPVPPVSQGRPGISAELDAVVRRCLAKSPDSRFPDAESLDAALAECRLSSPWTPQSAAAWWAAHVRDPANLGMTT